MKKPKRFNFWAQPGQLVFAGSNGSLDVSFSDADIYYIYYYSAEPATTKVYFSQEKPKIKGILPF